ncbi:Metallo-dependent phosphatase-like protein [Hygrophoropsis aurantiaca]|uniref:Metallo-dependent phosphatase-like protein n=1 Tax=Hygrophoropsis aurantiaca TaxID=72124 RepID=A0ACB8A5H8_9AGAM|nr:Metallo-dependent phosphatase-like protein [Hygrophoropsis aurantiaca]
MPGIQDRKAPSQLFVTGLSATWVLLVLWYEVGTFIRAGRSCEWPDSLRPTPEGARVARILVIADPQIIDHRSYPGRGRWLSALSQFMVDLNLRRNWHSTFHGLRPHAVVFLGDMMDGGRTAMVTSEYEAYYARFRDIFKMGNKAVPVYYLPGNHDIGIGDSNSFSLEGGTRYSSHFGPRNYRISISNHTLMFIDAPALVEEDVIRASRGYTYDNWPAVPGGPIDFLMKYASRNHSSPVILLSHIPMARPLDASCGPLRERGTIRQGFGFGYQNTLMDDATRYILGVTRPSLILSGDDHDYCEYVHDLPYSRTQPAGQVREITVKSFSMAMGVRHPGFQLLSLTSSAASSDTLTQIPSPPLTTPCLLPDQLGIYLFIYVPFIILSLIFLLIVNIYRYRSRNSHPTFPQFAKSSRAETPPAEMDDSYDLSAMSYGDSPGELSRRSLHSELGELENGDIAPLPSPEAKAKDTNHLHSKHRAPRTRATAWAWTFVLGGQRRRISVAIPCFSRPYPANKTRDVGFLRGFTGDVFDVAWPPLFVFCVAAWWEMK